MRKLFVLVAFVFISISGYSQIFSTGQTLKSGEMSVGLEPAVFGSDFAFYFHGGYGISSGADLGLKLGFGHYGNAYVEGNVEWALITSNPYLSAKTGAHYNGNFGFDGAMLLTFPVSRVYLTSGLDANLDFYNADQDADGKDELHTNFPVWIPFGLEVYVKKQMSIIFEAEVPVNGGGTFVGAGLSLYF
jgi:hypothetical protein